MITCAECNCLIKCIDTSTGPLYEAFSVLSHSEGRIFPHPGSCYAKKAFCANTTDKFFGQFNSLDMVCDQCVSEMVETGELYITDIESVQGFSYGAVAQAGETLVFKAPGSLEWVNVDLNVESAGSTPATDDQKDSANDPDPDYEI